MVLAAIAGAHGVTGEVRLKLFAESVESLKRYRVFEADGRALTLKSVREGSHGAVARFAEVADRDAAEALRGRELSVPRDALPTPQEGEIYVADLIGLPARTPDATLVGTSVGHENFGAGDLIEVELANGTRILVPFARCEMRDGELVVDPAFLE